MRTVAVRETTPTVDHLLRQRATRSVRRNRYQIFAKPRTNHPVYIKASSQFRMKRAAAVLGASDRLVDWDHLDARRWCKWFTSLPPQTGEQQHYECD